MFVFDLSYMLNCEAVQTETCRHSRLLAARNEKGLKIKRPKVAAATFLVAARRDDTLEC